MPKRECDKAVRVDRANFGLCLNGVAAYTFCEIAGCRCEGQGRRWWCKEHAPPWAIFLPEVQ